MRKFAILIALMALGPFVLAACGGDDEESSDEPAAEQPAASGGGSTLAIAAVPSGDLAFEEDTAQTKAGTVTIEFTNDSPVAHDVQIEDGGSDLGGTETVTGSTAEAAVDLEAGEYTFYCSVAGHRDGGMEGTLTVK